MENQRATLLRLGLLLTNNRDPDARPKGSNFAPEEFGRLGRIPRTRSDDVNLTVDPSRGRSLKQDGVRVVQI